MSTSNPFGKLKIERDEEDREEMAQQKKSTGEGNQLFAPIQGEQKKKKKVRQEKKETQDDNEGFEVVGGKKEDNYGRRANESASFWKFTG